MSDTSANLRLLLGARAVHVPAWLYVQDMGEGIVAFVGGSRVPDIAHPLRYGSARTHQFVVGEVVVRPHRIVATDALRGKGLAGLIYDHDIDAMLAMGEEL